MTTDGWRPPGMIKQVNRLVAASEATPDPAFLHRILTLCSLPRTNPGNRIRYVRHNGPYTLGMTAGIKSKLPLRAAAPADDGLRMQGSGANPKPRGPARGLAFRFHEGA